MGKERKDREWGRRPTKAAAVKAIAEAVRTGRVVRPEVCPRCGDRPGVDSKGITKIQAIHVNGYAFEHRGDVEWMCVSCRNSFAWEARRRREQERCDICGELTGRGSDEPRLTHVNGSKFNGYHSICFDCYLPGGYG